MRRNLVRMAYGQTRVRGVAGGVEWPVRLAKTGQRVGPITLSRGKPMDTKTLGTGVVLQFAARRRQHGSGLRGGALAAEDLSVQRLQLPVVPRQDIGDIPPNHLAEGGLGDPGAFGDLGLSESAVDQSSDEVFGFHSRIPSRLLCHSPRNMQAGLNGTMPRSDQSLAARVKNRRLAKGLTQSGLAKASGLKQPDISKIELGLIVKTTGIARLADALGVSPLWLETGDGVPDAAAPPPLPPTGFTDRREVSDSDWGLLMDVKIATTEKEKQDIRERAAELRAQVTRQLAQVSRPTIRREELLNPAEEVGLKRGSK